MLEILILFWCFFQVGSNGVGNPNNYAEPDLCEIKQQLDRKFGASYYDILILQVHINVNAKFVETSINDEINRLLDQEQDWDCLDLLEEFAEKARKNCQMQGDFDLLNKARGKFGQLKEVTFLTIETCQELNPLDTQGDRIERCELSKIADLRRQIVLVGEEYEILKGKLFEDHDNCIRELMSTTFADLAKIVYGTCRKTNSP